MSWIDHLVIAPILLPLITGAVLLFPGDQRRHLKARVSVVSALLLVGISVALLVQAEAGDAGAVTVYRLGNWPAPFAIVLVLDRLAAVMVLLTSVLGACSLLYSVAKWQRAGAHFHSIFQFLLAGLNGAFLTGDLFNLFVFFELLLAGSYGLVLHGSELRRVKAGLHYIAINLLASSMFLIGVSLIYSVTGTLNMADLAVRIAEVAPEDQGLLQAGAGVLAVAFLIKAGMYPLCFWLPSAYSAASPPAAAIFSVMTKVGIYVLLRLSTLADMGGDLLFWGGVVTIAFGSAGVLATQDLSRLTSYSVLVSSGTVLAAVGLGGPEVTGAGLFYLVGSTLGIAALFLLTELVERGREAGADVLAVTMEAYGVAADDILEAEEEEEPGVAIPATLALLGGSFLMCALLLSGLPPLPGFLGKFALIDGLFASAPSGVPFESWALLAVLLASGAATLIAMARAGIRIFWSVERSVPQVRVVELAPVAVLLLLCVAMTIQAGPIMHYMRSTAQALSAPAGYIQGVLGEAPR